MDKTCLETATSFNRPQPIVFQRTQDHRPVAQLYRYMQISTVQFDLHRHAVEREREREKKNACGSTTLLDRRPSSLGACPNNSDRCRQRRAARRRIHFTTALKWNGSWNKVVHQTLKQYVAWQCGFCNSATASALLRCTSSPFTVRLATVVSFFFLECMSHRRLYITCRLYSASWSPLQYTVRRPRSGELRTQKWKTHLLRTPSLMGLPLEPWVAQCRAIYATLIAKNFFLANFYPHGPFICIFSETSPEFFPC